MWWIWSRLWEEENGILVLWVPCQLDSVGYCAVASRFDSCRLLLDLSEKGVYSSYTLPICRPGRNYSYAGAERPWDWKLYYPVKQIFVLGLSSRIVEKSNILKKFLGMVFFMVFQLSEKLSQ